KTYGYDYAITTPPAPPDAPTAALALSPAFPTPGVPVRFDASASTAPSGGSITDYSWDFGDGGTDDTGSTATDSHTYTARGAYTVTVTVKTSTGQTDASKQMVTVDDPPTAAFTAPPSAVPAGTPVAFDASASTPGGGGSITDYSWSFGDGSTADGGAGPAESH